MATNVIGQVSGGTKQVFDEVGTVSAVKSKLGIGEGYTAAVNGDPASDQQALENNDMVTFSKAVKGGHR